MPSNPSPQGREREDPLQLLREAIASLNASSAQLPDQTQVADLLAEARAALERAKLIAGAVAECQQHLEVDQFEKAFQSLDACLQVYPNEHALLARRSQVETRQRAFQEAAAARTAIDEAQWLLDQDRPDLAALLLKDKAAELPGQTVLQFRLEAVESLLPEWEKKRQIQTALEQVSALEQIQQWHGALTIIEQALQASPDAVELLAAAQRVRTHLANRGRDQRLALRLKLIGQKVAIQDWQHAQTLLEDAQKEFPGATEFEFVQREVQAGQRRAQCQTVAAEVRRLAREGQLELAELTLSKAVDSLGPQSALDSLRAELDGEARYRDDLQKARTLFSRHQLEEAEAILGPLAAQGRPEAQALLDKVKQARTDAADSDACERGREKVLALMQQHEYAQAYDLLNSLRSEFPGNAVLERDLVGVQFALALQSAGAPPAAGKPTAADKLLAAEKQSEKPAGDKPAGDKSGDKSSDKSRAVIPIYTAVPSFSAPPAATPAPAAVPATRPVTPVAAASPRRGGRLGTAVAATLMLASVGGAAWKLSRGSTTVSKAAAPPPVTTLPAAAVEAAPPDTPDTHHPAADTSHSLQHQQPPSPSGHQPAPASSANSNSGSSRNRQADPPRESTSASLRPFVQPAAKQPAANGQSASLPLPPGAAPVISISSTTLPTGLPAGLVKPGSVAPPSPTPTPTPTPAAAKSAPPSTVPTGGNFQSAQLVDKVLPEYPKLANQLGIFGTVQLEASIDERGNVTKVKVLKGDPVLAKAAEQAVQRWKYKAATLNGKAIASTLAVQMTFTNPIK